MSTGNRILELTVYEATNRPLRRGHWSRWELALVNAATDGMERHSPLAKGWIKTYNGATYAQFRFGDETDISRRMVTIARGIERVA